MPHPVFGRASLIVTARLTFPVSRTGPSLLGAGIGDGALENAGAQGVLLLDCRISTSVVAPYLSEMMQQGPRPVAVD
jgi:hypothetical protein